LTLNLNVDKMDKVLGIVSGKGGVGKTTTAINLGLVLNNFGRRVVVVDGDLLKPNIGAVLGVKLKEIKNHTIHHAVKNNKKLDEIVYVHSSGLKFIPGDHTDSSIKDLNKEVFEDMKSSELIILDTPPGFGEDTRAAIRICDAVLVVVTPEEASIQAGIKTINIAREEKVKITGIVLNRKREGSYGKTEIESITGIPVIGEIIEDKSFEEAAYNRHPVTYYYYDSSVTDGYKALAAKLLGEKYEGIQDKKERDSPINKILKKLGFKPLNL